MTHGKVRDMGLDSVGAKRTKLEDSEKLKENDKSQDDEKENLPEK